MTLRSLQFEVVVPFVSSWGDLAGEKVVISASLNVGRGRWIDVPFIVDTGAEWCVLSPQHIADMPGAPERRIHQYVRNTEWEGPLYRVPLLFGDPSSVCVEVEATVFVPDLHPGDRWEAPNFLGLSALSRLCWALDPDNSLLYFAGARGRPS